MKGYGRGPKQRKEIKFRSFRSVGSGPFGKESPGVPSRSRRYSDERRTREPHPSAICFVCGNKGCHSSRHREKSHAMLSRVVHSFIAQNVEAEDPGTDGSYSSDDTQDYDETNDDPIDDSYSFMTIAQHVAMPFTSTCR